MCDNLHYLGPLTSKNLKYTPTQKFNRMKNFTILMTLLIVMTLFSFRDIDKAPADQEQIIQLALNVETIEKILKKGPDDEYLPVVLITNKLVPEDMHITLLERRVKLVPDMEDTAAMGDEFSFVELKEIKVGSTNAKLQFQLDDYKITVKLKNHEDEWLYRSSTSRKKGHFSIDTEI